VYAPLRRHGSPAYFRSMNEDEIQPAWDNLAAAFNDTIWQMNP
jgi:hypothetical protein